MSSRMLRAVCAIALSLSACRGEEQVPVVEGVIDRETFIEAYVDLRVATIEGSDLALPVEERDSVLAEHGVSADDLTAFVEAYGRYLDYMSSLWSDVEARLEARSPAPGALREPT